MHVYIYISKYKGQSGVAFGKLCWGCGLILVKCQVADCEFTVAEPKVPFRRKLQDVEVQEKMSAMLMCELPANSTQASWFMEETRLEQSNKYHMEQEGTLRRLTIHNVTTNDDAVYICEMKEGSRTVAELTVLGMSGPMVQWC